MGQMTQNFFMFVVKLSITARRPFLGADASKAQLCIPCPILLYVLTIGLSSYVLKRRVGIIGRPE